MEITRLFDILQHYDTYFNTEDAICCKENGIWTKYSIRQYIDKVNYISYGLMQLGIKKGDKVATITGNRPEWNFIDMALMQLGAIHVSIYPTISESDYKYILNHAQVKMVFVSGWELLRKIENIISEMPEIQNKVYTFRDLRGYKHLNEIIELGIANQCSQYLNEIKDRISSDDPVTLIYTSGTTGNSKGVMLTHNNILQNIFAIAPIVPIREDSRVLSYLPLCHIYERMMNYTWQLFGIPVYYAESLAKIADNLVELRPTIFTTVPRLLEKFYDKIISVGRKQKFIKRKIFFWADEIAKSYSEDKQTLPYRIKLTVARKLVLKQWTSALGGNFDVIISGGAALQPLISKIFFAMGITVLNGYGLTETSPVIAVSTFFKDGTKIGTVGPQLPGIEVKIADDGEILTRGHCVMKGYYKADNLTKEVIDSEGWFHTGDIGIVEPKGQIRITGRKKEIFKTAFGKYVVPTLIENKFLEDSLIDNIMVVGDNKQFAAALIVPEFSDLRSWCNRKNIEYTTNEEMIKHPEVLKKYKKIVNHYNKFFGNTEQIKKFILVSYQWSIETGELTPTLKIKRNYISEKYNDVIESLFN